MNFTSVVVFLKSHSPIIIMRKNIKQNPDWGNILQDTWLVFLKTAKIMKNQGKTEKMSYTRRDWGTQQLNAMCNPGLDFGAERGH